MGRTRSEEPVDGLGHGPAVLEGVVGAVGEGEAVARGGGADPQAPQGSAGVERQVEDGVQGGRGVFEDVAGDGEGVDVGAGVVAGVRNPVASFGVGLEGEFGQAAPDVVGELFRGGRWAGEGEEGAEVEARVGAVGGDLQDQAVPGGQGQGHGARS
ncbi:hypothetical protein [Streptomyces acidiscabies]|uniref:hypothetical protein n=1 Tax=Streptomyces acidiscabies TaxID=42234 RepID=UPI0011463577|nr:hypothetical protein [Streptomyces acidiscabies]